MRKTVLILWGVGALFLISSIPLFVEGDIGAGVCGIVIAAALFFIGLRKKAARPEPKKRTARGHACGDGTERGRRACS